jgi:hypothetical protein
VPNGLFILQQYLGSIIKLGSPETICHAKSPDFFRRCEEVVNRTSPVRDGIITVQARRKGKVRSKKTYDGMDVETHAFLSSTIDGVAVHLHKSVALMAAGKFK